MNTQVHQNTTILRLVLEKYPKVTVCANYKLVITQMIKGNLR